MTAYSVQKNVEGAADKPANRALLRQLDCREDIRRIFEKIGDYAASRGCESHIDLNDPPKVYVHAPEHRLPSLKVTIEPDGRFSAALTEAFIDPKFRTGMQEQPVGVCDQRYEVIELAVRFIKGTADLQDRPVPKSAFWSMLREEGPSDVDEPEAPAEAEAPPKRAGVFPLSLFLVIGLVAAGALLFLMGKIA